MNRVGLKCRDVCVLKYYSNKFELNYSYKLDLKINLVHICLVRLQRIELNAAMVPPEVFEIYLTELYFGNGCPLRSKVVTLNIQILKFI